MIRKSLTCAVLALSMQCTSGSVASATATFVINNLDGPGEGFNDPTAVAPLPGNPGTTLGAQRLNAFQAAADAFGQILDRSVTIVVDANIDPLDCSAFFALLGQAGPINVLRDFPSAPRPATWFPVALANSLAGFDLDPSLGDIVAQFNSRLDDDPTCLIDWWYGVGAPAPAGTISFFDVVLHEIGHGLGFLTLVNLAHGQKFFGLDDIYMTFLEDHSSGLNWSAMTDAQRAASAVDTGDLDWTGPEVNDCAAIILSAGFEDGHTRMFAPNPLQGQSSVNHWDTVLAPDELMEPFINRDLDQRLTERLMADIGWTVEAEPCDLLVAVDIRPQQCANRVRTDRRGSLPVAIVGTDGFDVRHVDLESIRLAGVVPKDGHTRFRDMATAFEPLIGKDDARDCTRQGADGLEDLVMRFNHRRVVRALGPVSDREVVMVPLTGALEDGTPIRGEDVILVIEPNSPTVSRSAPQIVSDGE